MSRKVCGCSHFLAWVAGIRSLVAGICDFFECLKNSRDKFSLKIVTEWSRVSRTHLESFSNLVSASQKVRDNFVSGWRPMKLK